MLRSFTQTLLRSKTPIVFEDKNRTAPISNQFGLDRGTPIDRYYIDQFLTKNAEWIRGRTVEIAEATYSKMYGKDRVTQSEILFPDAAFPGVTIVGDLTRPSELPENVADCFICTQTLNVIFEVQKAIEGAHRLLKPGGVLLVTVPGISQISRYDMDRWGDYWRFTTLSLEKLFQPVFGADVTVQSFGNAMAATAFLQGVALEDLPNKSLLDQNDPDYQVIITVVAVKG